MYILATEWIDSNVITIGSFVFGIVGTGLAIVSYTWTRKESRLTALSEILHHMVKAAQNLTRANDCRQTCEQLQFSFPDPTKAPEAVQRVKSLVDEYNEKTEEASKEYKLAEAEFVSKSFRFPDKVCKLMKTTMESLSKAGGCVNNGMHDKAELEIASFRDNYKKVVSYARGWRLANPFEGIIQKFKKPATEKPEDEYELTEKEMNQIMDLVHKRATSQRNNSYCVHPPKKLLENPDIAKSDNVIKELDTEIFSVVFQDGTSVMMSFVELMVFTYNLIILAHEMSEAAKISKSIGDKAEKEFKISVKFSIRDIMKPEVVKLLLDKIEFSKDPSDAK